jgi:hypothetical protein
MLTMSDVRSQIELRERDIPRHSTQEYPRVTEIESHEAHMGLPLPPVEVERWMHERPNHEVRHFIADEDQVRPASGEKDAQCARGRWSVEIE